MAIVDKPWDGSASRWTDTASYCDSALINENTGDRKDWVQSKCHLPVKEPNGDINKNALSAAAGRLMQTKISPAEKKAAARKLKALYGQAKMEPPESLKNMAG